MITLVDGTAPAPWRKRAALIGLMVCAVSLEYFASANHYGQLIRGDAARDRASKSLEEATDSAPRNNATSQPLCSRQQVQDGAWHPVMIEKAPYIPPNHSKLLCDQFQIQRYQQGNVESLEWKPNDDACRLAGWDRDQFCTLMRQQTILFIGDSLSQEASFSFGELLGLRTSLGIGERGGFPRYNLEGACNGTVEAIFRRDDLLTPSEVGHALQGRLPDVAVLNRGAHYVSDDVLLQEMKEMIVQIKVWQSSCAQAGKRCLLIWRTTVPGHPGCKNASQLTTNRTAMERLIESDAQSRAWKWPLFQHQNQLIEEALSKSGVDFEMMDAYYINILSRNGHRTAFNDCLHSCLNSKLDVYSQLLLHILQRRDWGTEPERPP